MASSDELAANFRELSSTADLLNKSSDELTDVVGLLGGALRELNIGLAVWVTFETWNDELDETSTQHQIGYDKVAGKWGISLRRQHWEFGEEKDTDGPWSFTDAPREMRLASVDHLSALLHELNEKASQTALTVREKTQQARNLVEAVKGAAVGGLASPVQDVSHLYNIRGHNISRDDIDQIMGSLLEEFPMVNAWLRHSCDWELDKGMLKIYLPKEKPQERNHLAHEGTAAIENAAKGVLNAPITVRFFPIIGDEWAKVLSGKAGRR